MSRRAKARSSFAASLLASAWIAGCGTDHGGLPANHCVQDCLTGGETLVISPAQSLLLADSDAQLTATLVAKDGSHSDVTAVVRWTSNDPRIATVVAGEVTGAAPGHSKVTASLADLRAQADVLVTNLTAEEIVVSPAYLHLLAGLSQQYTATAVLSDGSTVDVTREVTWSTDNAAVDEIDEKGLDHAVAEGVTSVDAHYEHGTTDLSDQATVVVRPPDVTIDAFVIEPEAATSAPGAEVRYRAVVVTSEDEVLDVTDDASWESSDQSVARVEGNGVVRAVAPGAAEIRAHLTYGTLPHTATASLTVVAPELTDFRVDPEWTELLVGQRQQYSATIVVAGEPIDVTDRVLWQSFGPAVAGIDQHGMATAVAVGATTIRGGLSYAGVDYFDDADLDVRSPPLILQSLSVEPPDATVLVDDDLQYRCLAAFSDGSLHDVTQQCLWSSADEAVAVIDRLTGLMTGTGAGRTQIRGTFFYQGSRTEAVTAVTVVSPVMAVGLEVTPAEAESVVHGARQYFAHVLLSDGRKLDVTAHAAWTSGALDVAEVTHAGLARARAPGQAPIRAAVKHEGVELADAALFEVAPPAVTVEEFRVVPPRQAIVVGGVAQFDAELLLSDGRRVTVTDQVLWSELDKNIVRGTERKGRFVGLQAGTTSVQASFTYLGLAHSSIAQLSVVDTPIGLEIEPAAPHVTVHEHRQLQAILLLSSGAGVDVTHRGYWTSADPAVATVDEDGLLVGVAGGLTTVTKTVVTGATTTTASVKVSVLDPATQLVALRVSPRHATETIGAAAQFTATAYFLDGSRDDVSALVSWEVADTGVAHLSSQDGVVLAKAEGTTAVTAHYYADGKVLADSAVLDVEAPVVTISEIQVIRARVTVAAGNEARFTATAVLSDGAHEDVTRSVQWRSSSTAIAQSTRVPGEFATFEPGSTTISAGLTYQNQRYVGQAELIVQAAAPVYLELEPPRLHLTINESVEMQAILHLTNNTTSDVTRDVSWRSQNTGVATVTSGHGKGVVTGIAAGGTSVTAQYHETLSASVEVEVAAPVLLSIDILPATATMHAGFEQDFTAIANYDDDSAIDVTDRALWSSSDDAIAEIVGGDAQGLVEGVAAGTATISAAFDGVSGSASLTVNPAVPVTLEVAPDGARIDAGDEHAFVAVAILSDGLREEVTKVATWTTSNTLVAAVGDQPGSAGVAQGLSAGSAEIRARYRGLEDSTTLSVLPPTITAIVVIPANDSVTVGSDDYYRATATMSDSSTLDVTTLVRWVSSDPVVAAVSNGVEHGHAKALSPGSTTISAILESHTGQAALTVTGECTGKPDSVVIAGDLTIHVGGQAQMRVRGIYPGGCVQDETEGSATIWDSSERRVFKIGRKSGIVTGIGPGVATAEAKLRGKSDSALVTVLP
jgi:trimeric autotransporter adhesin